MADSPFKVKTRRCKIRRFILMYLIVIGIAFLILQVRPDYLFRPAMTASYTGGLQPGHVNNEGYLVPIDFVVINSPSQQTTYGQQEFQTALDSANAIWERANVTFTFQSITYKEVSDELLNRIDAGNTTALKEQAKIILADRYDDGTIDMIFTKSIPNSGADVAVIDGNVSFSIAAEHENIQYTSWAFAHELGHTIGLRDVFEFDNLMIKVDGTSHLRFWYKITYWPSDITDEQVSVVHNTIETKSYSIV